MQKQNEKILDNVTLVLPTLPWYSWISETEEIESGENQVKRARYGSKRNCQCGQHEGMEVELPLVALSRWQRRRTDHHSTYEVKLFLMQQCSD